MEVLCDDNFTSVTKSIRSSFIFLKSSHCPFCKAAEPSVQHISKLLGHRASFFQVDVDECRQTSRHFKVAHTPTLASVRYGLDFIECSNNVSSLYQCIHDASLPLYLPISSKEDLIDLFESNQSFFLTDAQLKQPEEAEKVSLHYRFYLDPSYKILHTIIPSAPKSILYFRYEDRQLLPVSSHSISEFIGKNAAPPYSAFSMASITDILIDKTYVIFVKLLVQKEKLGNFEHQYLWNLSSTKIPVYYFSSESSSLFDELVTPSPTMGGLLVAVLYIDSAFPKRWVSENPSNPAEFLKEVLSGKVEPYIKSEDPKLKSNCSVPRITGKSYKTEIEESKVPFVLFAYKGEEYAVSQCIKRLEDAKSLFGKIINVGSVDLDLNEIPVNIDNVPSFVLLYNSTKVTFEYGSGTKLSDWIKASIPKMHLDL